MSLNSFIAQNATKPTYPTIRGNIVSAKPSDPTVDGIVQYIFIQVNDGKRQQWFYGGAATMGAFLNQAGVIAGDIDKIKTGTHVDLGYLQPVLISYDSSNTRAATASESATLVKTITPITSVPTAEQIQATMADKQAKAADWREAEQPLAFTPVGIPNFSSGTQTRIGYAVLGVDVAYVEQSRQSYINQIPALRQIGNLKQATGKAYETYTISYLVKDSDEIASAVQEVVEQLSLTPFLPVEGGPFGSTPDDAAIPYNAIAVKGFSVSTIPGQPNSLKVDINFDPFNWEYHCGIDAGDGALTGGDRSNTFPRYQFDDMFCYPLFKLWCKTRAKSRFKPGKFSGQFVLSFPTDELYKSLPLLLRSSTFTDSSRNLSALRGLQTLIEKPSNTTQSPDVKYIRPFTRDSSSTNHFVVKVYDEQTWKKLVPYAIGNIKTTSGADSELANAFSGLVWWNKVSAFNVSDELGNLLPSSNSVNPTIISGALSLGQPLQQNTREVTSLAELRSPKATGKSLDQQLNDWAPSSNVFSSDTTALKAMIRENPWDFFGVLIEVDNNNKDRVLKSLSATVGELSTKSTVSYTSLNSKIADAFQDDMESEAYLAIGSPGNPSNTDDIIIEGVSGTRGHNLSMYSGFFDPLPIHQYMGGMGAMFSVEGKCFGLKAKKQLEAIKQEFDRRALHTPSSRIVGIEKAFADAKLGPAFLKVKNELFQLLGVDFVIPEALVIQSVDGQPDVWAFSLTLIEHDISTMNSEKIEFLPTYLQNLGKAYYQGVFNAAWGGNTNPIVDRAREHFSLLHSLSQTEVYPDMALPTHSELKYWVELCQKASKNYLDNRNNKKQSKGLKLTSASEGLLVSYIQPFFREYAAAMAKWDAKTRSVTPYFLSQNGFVDPDFYCWYDHRTGWRTTFDVVSEGVLGAMDARLGAKGSQDEIPPVWRQTDTEYDAVTMNDHRFFSLDEGHLKETCGDKRAGTDGTDYFRQNTYPKEIAEKLHAEVKRRDREYDESAPVNWWLSLGTINREDNTVSISETYNELFRKSNILPNTMGDFQDTGESPDELVSILDDVGVKQTITRELLSLGRGKTLPDAQLQRTGVFVRGNISNSFSMSAEAKAIVSIVVGSLNRALTVTDFKQLATALVDSQLTNQVVFPPKPFDQVDFTGESAALCYLSRTIAETERFNRAKAFSKSLSTFDHFESVTGEEEGNLEDTWYLINVICAKVGVDPNVIRSVIFSRAGVRTSNPSFSNRTGFADYDAGALDAATVDATVSGFKSKTGKGVARIASTYKKYLDEFQSPTIALLAMDKELEAATNASGSRGLSVKDKDDLEETAKAVKLSPATEKAEEALHRVVNNLDHNGTVDVYYQKYLEICRSYGSVVNDSFPKDMFFNPLHGLILIDAEENKSGIVAKFSPSGRWVTVASDRSQVNQVQEFLRKNSNRTDLRELPIGERALKERKLKNALSPASETSMYGFLHDLRHHGCFNRLLGAFPSYQILLINEGYYYLAGNVKLWDQYYTRTGVAGIEVFRGRKDSAAECNITFSNMYHKLTSYFLQHALEQQVATYTRNKIGEAIRGLPTGASIGPLTANAYNLLLKKEPDKDLLKIWQNNHLKQLALNVGTRVQVRMGHGSQAQNLPVVFNGTVASVPIDDGYVSLLCVGDGGELNNQSTTKLVPAGNSFAFEDGGAFGTGKDPSSIISEAMIAGGTWDSILQGNFRDWSQGIAHFGDVYYSGMKSWPAELQINIYSSNPTKLEQDLSSVQNYFNVNALYNFNNSHLFSIEVHEPTPWKVIDTCRRACLDYVGSAELFSTRSTLFFGKWWWPYHYTWDESVLNLDTPETKKGQNNQTIPTFSGESIAYPGGYKGPPTSSYKGSPTFNQTPQGTTETRGADPLKNLNDLPAAISNDLVNRHPEVSRVGVKSYRIGTVRDALQNFTKYTIHLHSGVSLTYDYAFGGLGGDSALFRGEYHTSDVENSPQIYLPDAAKSPNVLDSHVLNSNGDQNSPADLIHDAEELVNYLKWKPYMQAYFAHSMLNLLDNNIETTKEGVFTDAIGQHSFNGFLSGDSVVHTITFSTDSDIISADRSTALVETGIALTGMQEGIGKAIGSGATKALSYIPLVGSLFDELNTSIRETPSTPAIENSVVSFLVDSLKGMYRGTMTMAGMATIKPRDFIWVTDHINDLTGPVAVKEVIHRMDTQVGFLTIVTPDCIVMPHSSEIGSRIITALGAGPLHRLGALMIFKASAAATWGLMSGKIRRKADLRSLESLRKYNLIISSSPEGLLPESVTPALKGKADEAIRLITNERVDEISKQLGSATEKDDIERLIAKRDQLIKLQDEAIAKVAKVGKGDLVGLVSALEQSGFGAVIHDEQYKVLDVLPGGRVRAEAIIFEEQLVAEERLMREEVAKGKVFKNLNKNDVELGIRKMFAEKRKVYYESLGTDGEKVFADIRNAIISDTNIPELNKQINKTLDEIQKLTTGAPGEESINIAARKELLDRLDTQAARYFAALDNTPFDDLEPELQRIVTRVRAHYKLINDIPTRNATLRNILIDAPFGSVGTLVKGVGGALGEVPVSTTRTLKAVKQGVGKYWNKPSALIQLGMLKLENMADLVGLKGSEELAKIEDKSSEAYKAAKEADDVLRRRKQLITLWRLKKRAKGGYQAAKDVVTAGRILSYAGPQAVVRLALDVAMFTVGGQIIEGLNARAKARQCVKIIPLMAGDHPYVAGLRGHAGAVLGDDPSWSDKMITDFAEKMQGGGWLIASLISPIDFSGFKPPTYGRTEVDNAWLAVFENRANEIEDFLKKWDNN